MAVDGPAVYNCSLPFTCGSMFTVFVLVAENSRT